MSWPGHSAWWLAELDSDPAYEEVVTPLMRDLVAPTEGRYLDVGCGEGRLARALGDEQARFVGLDSSIALLQRAADALAPVAFTLPSLACFRDRSFDGAIVSLVLEHVQDHRHLLAELARVVRAGGVLAMVANHPVYTAPESAAIVDTDGETLWRPGRYFDDGWTDEPAGEERIRFHHRSMAELLTSAATAGWDLDRLVERGPSEGQIERLPMLSEQRHVPRLLGVRWVRRSQAIPA